MLVVGNASHTMCLNGLRKSTPPQNRQLIVSMRREGVSSGTDPELYGTEYTNINQSTFAETAVPLPAGSARRVLRALDPPGACAAPYYHGLCSLKAVWCVALPI